MSASISTSMRLLKIPKLRFSNPKSTIPSTTLFPSLPFSKPISFQRIPTSTKTQTFSIPSSSASTPTSLQPIEELPPKLQQIVKLFQSVPEPKAKYEQLLFYGKNLKPLDTHFKTRENKVEGCVSQVWVRAYLDDDKNVVFEADSDSVLTKGLAALLVQGLSGRPVEEIVRVSPDFVVLLGLQQSLTPSRNNGFLNMLKLMQKKAVEVAVEDEKGIGSSSRSASEGEEEAKGLNLGGNGNVGAVSGEVVVSRANSTLEGSGDDKGENLEEKGSSSELNLVGLGRRGMRIKEVLEKELRPVELEVEDISYQHAGHAGVRGSGDGETHFNVKIVSKEFEGKSLVKRHRLIYGLLQEELQSGLHALSIVAKTPAEVGAR